MLILGIILGIFSLIFIMQNLESVSYDFLVWTLTAPRFLVFLIILITGLILGWSFKAFRKKKK
ncbi:MAG: hypothetical protein RQ801_00990 [Spirochaetaceae bacterium]|nr:hypothetical protein [Spirochaetaceae bacterium]MDT8296846.1 hypothetical protein [Spirochaetaceae bacterium]